MLSEGTPKTLISEPGSLPFSLRFIMFFRTGETALEESDWLAARSASFGWEEDLVRETEIWRGDKNLG